MSLPFAHAPLQIVHAEIVDTLVAAQKSLEEYHNNLQAKDAIEATRKYLHQVYGCLLIIELYGAALLVEEMEQLSNGMIANAIDCFPKACEELMSALLRLPLYLEVVHDSEEERPLLLLQQINAIRSCRGAKELEQEILFIPNLATVNRFSQKKLVDNQDNAPSSIEQLAQTFEKNLLQVFRNQNNNAAIEQLCHLCEQVASYSNTMPVGEFWWVATAAMEALQDNGMANFPDTNKMLRCIYKELRALINSKDVTCQEVPMSAMRLLLYQLSQIECELPKVLEVKNAFNLKQVSDIDDLSLSLFGPDKQAIRTVVGEIKEEFSQVKESLDVFVRGSDRDLVALSEVGKQLGIIADTLHLLGMNAEQQVIKAQEGFLQQIAKCSREGADSELLDIASSLLYVETMVDERMAPGFNWQAAKIEAVDLDSQRPELSQDEQVIANALLDGAKRVLLSEARIALGRAKSAMIMYVNHSWDVSRLAAIPDIIKEIKGGLVLLGLKQPARLIDSCRTFICQQILAKSTVPKPTDLEILADAIIGVDYLLECKLKNKVILESTLVLAEDNLKQIINEQ